jgi:hypothetical protein
MEYFDIPFGIAMVVSFVGPVKRLTQIIRLLSLLKMRGGGCVDVLWYFKRPTTKQIQQDRLPLAASHAEKYNLVSIHLNGELIRDS